MSRQQKKLSPVIQTLRQWAQGEDSVLAPPGKSYPLVLNVAQSQAIIQLMKSVHPVQRSTPHLMLPPA